MEIASLDPTPKKPIQTKTEIGADKIQAQLFSCSTTPVKTTQAFQQLLSVADTAVKTWLCLYDGSVGSCTLLALYQQSLDFGELFFP